MRSYFIFNGTNSTAHHILIEHTAPIQRGEERVQNIVIPGRAGDLTVIEGEDIYNPYIQSLTISFPGDQLAAVRAWLRGSGWVTFSTEADRRQESRIINALDVEKVPHSINWFRGDVQFYCQPIKRPLTDPSASVSSGGNIVNDGDMPMLPTIKLTGSGDMTVSILQKTLSIASVPSGGCIIDCEAQMVTNGTGTASLMASVSGEFPVVPVGTFALTYTGATGATVTRRLRYL